MRWKIAAVLVSLIAAAQLIKPLPPAANQSTADLSAISELAPAAAILNRSCRDCHSMGTAWPWYARIAPVSWLVAQDVSKGRQFLNFSRWDAYRPAQKLGFLAAMASATSQDRMPPPRYLWLHPGSRLSYADRQTITTWANAEFRRISRLRRVSRGSANGS